MEHFQNKNLIELFQLGIALNDQKQEVFLKKVALFSPQFAKELKKMFAANPSQIGLSGALDNIKQKQNDINAMHIPKAIGKFKIISILGFGGMGMVFLGEREDINQIVAVKVAHSSKPDSTKTQAITSEAKILASLQHPNIASLVDWGEYKKGYYIATEFVDGATIAHYCEAHQFTVKQRIKLLIKIIDAVEFAHDNLIIHRDIKPNNIMVDESGEPILIDFGVARLMESETAEHQQTQNAALTPSFASPEQRTGKNLSIRSDIYSLGAVLLNLITDQQIDNQTDQSVLPIIENLIEKDHKNNKSTWHKFSRQMRKDLSLILAKSLSFDAKQRYANAFSFKKDLQALLTLKPITAHEPSKWYWFKKFIARNKLVTSILTVTLMAIVFGGWQWYRAIEENKKTIQANQELMNYSNLLNDTLQSMDAFYGGSPHIKMEDFMKRAIELTKNEKKVTPNRLALHSLTLSKIYNSWGEIDHASIINEIGEGYAKISVSVEDDIELFLHSIVLLHNSSKFDKCIMESENASRLIEQSKNRESHKIALYLNSAGCYIGKSQYKKAEEMINYVIAHSNIQDEKLANSAYTLSNVQMGLFQLDKAMKNLKLAMKIYKNLHGEKSGMLINSEVLLLRLKANKDPNNFKLSDFNRVEDLFAELFKPLSINHAILKATLAEASYLKGNHKQAIKLQLEILDFYEKNSVPLFAIFVVRIQLAMYYIFNNDIELARKTIESIGKDSIEGVPDDVTATYYLEKAWLHTYDDEILLAEKSLENAKNYSKNTDSIGIKAELNFRLANLSGIKKEWIKCFEYSNKATDLASVFFPKTWQLSNAYRYLQDVCKQKLDGIENNSFPYLQAVLDSPWKQETVITTKILNQN